ncbi:hypothetical protein E4A47_10585 [Micrococcus flavus]|uniref:Uncharacterized protein n=1 Tax=Micrococcus flavus TaxID=384602 RepID=A0A4Y8WV91_9MICC|nr:MULTISPECIES: hypothetical protein [Micrococcus]MBB4883779.1 hypothetical protein [Micrococcus flavus]TFH99054.1 hypothetical protein E4A47_10585 [Micrococcus flavus]GGK47692.1 hypothetical protein GCM10007073_13460 [Micrococcus flavus]
MRLARAATLVAGAAAAYGLRAWQRNREGRQVWADATDGLPGPEAPRESAEDAHVDPEETPQG